MLKNFINGIANFIGINAEELIFLITGIAIVIAIIETIINSIKKEKKKNEEKDS